MLARFRLLGNVSGLELEREWAQLATLRGGLVTHEQYFFGWDKGLRAAGLDPDAIALPSREVPPAGFEPATRCLEGSRSIRAELRGLQA